MVPREGVLEVVCALERAVVVCQQRPLQVPPILRLQRRREELVLPPTAARMRAAPGARRERDGRRQGELVHWKHEGGKEMAT